MKAKQAKSRYLPGQSVTVVLPSVRARKCILSATIIDRDIDNDEEETWRCAVHLPATDTQPERSITLPGGYSLNQIEVSTQLSLF